MMRWLEQVLLPKEEDDLKEASQVSIDVQEEQELTKEMSQRVYEEELAKHIEGKLTGEITYEPLPPGTSFGVWSGTMKRKLKP